jgi:hypothetical protein
MDQLSKMCQLLKVGSVLAFECCSNEKLQRDMERVLWPIVRQLHGIHKIPSGQFGLSRCLKQKKPSICPSNELWHSQLEYYTVSVGEGECSHESMLTLAVNADCGSEC